MEKCIKYHIRTILLLFPLLRLPTQNKNKIREKPIIRYYYLCFPWIAMRDMQNIITN